MENQFNFKSTNAYAFLPRVARVNIFSILRGILWVALLLPGVCGYAQAPSISYNGPQVYATRTAITPLVPTSNGVGTLTPGSPGLYGKYNERTLPARPGLAVGAAGNIYKGMGDSLVKFSGIGGQMQLVGIGFGSITDLAVDASGNIYVANGPRHQILKLPAGGGTQIIVASGFSSYGGIAVDAKENIYYADVATRNIEKISATGGIPVTIGSGFFSPADIAVDTAGDVYVGDFSLNAVIKIPVSGGPKINVGSGYVSVAGVTVDVAGNVFVADGNGSILEVPTGGSGIPQVVAGSQDPHFLAVDGAGYLYFDLENGSRYDLVEVSPLNGYYINPILPAGLNFSNSTGIISGTPATVSPATDYTVTGYNTSGGSSAKLNIKVLSNNADLANMILSSGTLTPAFASGTINYTATVDTATSSLTLTPTVADATATVKVNGTTVTSGTASVSIPLAIGRNTITVVVTAQAGVTKTYTVTIGRGNPDLAGLAISTGTLAPVFASGTTAYTTLVSASTTSITVTPILADATSAMTVNGQAVLSGAASSPIPLSHGLNTINIVVTARNGFPTKTYIVTVSDGSTNAYLSNLVIANAKLSPVFQSTNNNYTAALPNNISSFTITPTTADPTATMTLNGTTATSGAASTPIALAEGADTVINTVVTAQNGSTIQTYSVTVTRAPSSNANLTGINLNHTPVLPAFSATTTAYTLSVSNSTTSTTLRPVTADANATIKVNGTATTSGTVFGPIALTEGAQTVINTVVTAQDGSTTKTYTVTVTRAPSSDANLSALGPSGLSPSLAFTTDNTSYAASVKNAITSMPLRPVSRDTNATIKVNGIAVKSGVNTGAIALSVGSNVITTVVTAQDEVTTKTYTLTITRAADATLSAIKLSHGILTPLFLNPNTYYTANVVNSISTITITPTPTDPKATIEVNGTAVTPGRASSSIPLAEGAQTVITVVVTGHDGITTETYTVTVTRAPSSNANLATMGQSVVGLTPAFSSGTTSYAISASSAIASMTLKPVSSDPNATIKVNGTAVASGTKTSPIALAVGPNTITTIVKAQNGTTTKTYTLTVTRASSGADSYDPLAADAGISVTVPIAIGTVETPQLADDGILVHQSVSPNGDGINDFLMIENISQYPDNKLAIMNRDGQLIFEAKGYDNSSKVFDGHSNKNGQMQLPGTYFYALDYTVKGILKHKTGFIVLKY